MSKEQFDFLADWLAWALIFGLISLVTCVVQGMMISNLHWRIKTLEDKR